MMTKFIATFLQINRHDAVRAGGKGASLGDMTQANIPVPPGFVILAAAFEKFLEETNLNLEIEAALAKVNHKETYTVEIASEKIRELILSASLPKDVRQAIQAAFKRLDAKLVAVRSSATAEDSVSDAWAGQLDTFLNTSSKNLLSNIQKCWASLFTARAIFYRFEKGLHKSKISVAVVVQKMIESEVAGIAFSVHPVTQDKNQLIIEAGWGLGEAVVSGQITPDSYVVNKQDWSLMEVNVNEQNKFLVGKKNGMGNEWRQISSTRRSDQKLSGKEIVELAHLVVKIEKHYGFPVDVEWAREKGKFYITQSRPITTLEK